MNKISKQITKKSLVQRQSSFAFWFIAALIVIWAIVQAWDEWDMLVVTVPIAAVMMGIVWFETNRNDRRIKKQIEQQEKYLGVSFDDDMRDVLMGGILSNGVEAAAYGDWYTLISTGGVVAVNRRYVTAVKDVRRWVQSGKYTDSTFIDITFETVEHETMKFTTGDSWQAILDLCTWLGEPTDAYLRKPEAGIIGNFTEIEAAQKKLEKAWRDYEARKAIWQEEKDNPDATKRWNAVGNARFECKYTERKLREYYRYTVAIDTEEKQRQREKELQRLYHSFYDVSRMVAAEGKDVYDVFSESKLFLFAPEFRKMCLEQEKCLEEMPPEEKAEQLMRFYDKVRSFADRFEECSLANKEIGRERPDGIDEAAAAVMEAADAMELLKQQIPSVELDEKIAELYGVMFANGLLPKEREDRFPERMREGEIHRIYEYDS